MNIAHLNHNLVLYKRLLFVCLFGMSAACGGGGGGGDEAPASPTDNSNPGTSAPTPINVGKTVGSVLRVVNSSTSSAQGSKESGIRTQFTQNTTSSVACAESGSATTSNTIFVPDEALSQDQNIPIPFTLDSTASLENCDGLSGSFTFGMEGLLSENSSSFVATINANIAGFDPEAGNCIFIFDNFIIAAESIDAEGNGSTTASGNLDAQCDAGSASCTLFNVDTNDTNAINDSCAFN